MVFTLGLRHTAVDCSSLHSLVESFVIQTAIPSWGGVVKTFRCTPQVPQTKLIQALQSETRQFSTDAGGYDILDGCSLFAVVAIRRGLLSKSDALSLAPDYERDTDFSPYPGAKCPSFTAPIRLALEHASVNNRELAIDDVWIAFQQYDVSQFRLLCDHYSIAPNT